jgi:DNA-binding transcriptional MerR regulator
LFSRSRSSELESWPTDNVLPFRAHRRPVHVHVAARRDDEAPAAGAAAPRTPLLTEEQLHAIETQHADGLTAVQIVDAFTSRNIKFSEASFRKYVQQGLLPRSRRVGRKGKHKGSLGVYPAKTVRRINTVKQLMDDGFTIAEIQGQILLYTDLIEGVGESLTELWLRFIRDSSHFDVQLQRELQKELSEARREGDRLVEKLGDIARRIAAPRTDTLRLAGAAGGAEDLL